MILVPTSGIAHVAQIEGLLSHVNNGTSKSPQRRGRRPVPFLGHARWTNPDVDRVNDIPGMERKYTKKRKAKGTGPATAPKRTRADPS